MAEVLLDASAVAAAGLVPAAVARVWRERASQAWPLFMLVWWSRRHGVTR
jgi:hypothetical protein